MSERRVGLDASVRERVRDLISANELPVTFDGPPTAELLAHMGRDKKRSGAQRNLVLLRAPGEVEIGAEAPDEVLVDAIDELRT